MIAAENGEDALDIIEKQSIDLAILDIMLPGISGLDVCRNIKAKKEIPVIMLSAKGEEIDRIVGLEVGADDYVTKPFSPHEVAIRARKLLRRNQSNDQQDEKEISVGNIRIFPDAYSVFIGDDNVQLTHREFKLLCYLANHAGRVKSRDQIINAVWGAEFAGETRIVDTLVKRLRKKLDQEGVKSSRVNIVTVFAVGYKLEVI